MLSLPFVFYVSNESGNSQLRWRRLPPSDGKFAAVRFSSFNQTLRPLCGEKITKRGTAWKKKI